MTDGLAGTSREAWDLLRDRWRNFARVSLVPVISLAMLAGLYVAPFFVIFFDVFETAASGQKIEQELIFKIIKFQLILLVATFGSLAIYNWWCVRLVRLIFTGDRRWFALDGKIAMSILMWMLYVMGIGAVTVFASFAVLLPVTIAIGAGAYLMPDFGEGPWLAVAGGLAGLVFLTLWITLISTIWLRLAAGLPPVAMGHTPDFYRDLWQRSRGYGWALVWRASLFSLAYFVLSAGFVLALSFGPIVDIANFAMLPQQHGLGPLLDKVFPLLRRIMMAEAVVMLASIPVFWWVVAWLCTVYVRIGTQTGRPNLIEPAG